MTDSPPLVLLTDFGSRDWYAGVMQGVIASIAPGCSVIALTHEIEPGNVAHGAWVLREQFRHFPAGAVFCCIVDPKVGMARRAMAMRGAFERREYRFIAPDNGLLDPIRRLLSPCEARELQNAAWLYGSGSNTFHGRDVFAPAAAHWLAGEDFTQCGPEMPDPVELRLPEPVLKSGRPAEILAQIMHVDHFGNAVLNLSREWTEQHCPSGATLVWQTANGERVALRRTFAEASPDKPLIYWGSDGALEIGVNLGDAAKRFNLRIGGAVKLDVNEAGTK
ncbi:SAM-dependent chlorinase/fluorinase [Candidatus Sumerlaeota bacterium]|nr:SAM-dependent chlorinase/fluorinase [Candidatus Sumerlaeota bacterium]